VAKALAISIGLTESCKSGFALGRNSQFLANRREPGSVRSLYREFAYDPPQLLAIGRCLRDSAAMREFAKALLKTLKVSLQRRSNWLRAFSEAVKYREDATKHISPELGLELTRLILAVFDEEVRRRKAKYIFRHSCVSIVYLLGIRRYDDTYLAPDSDLANRVKASFRYAKKLAEDGELQMVGGMVNLPKALNDLILYIDRQGGPVPIIATVD